MEDEPLAVYTHVTFYRKQTIEIYKTKVHLKGKVFLKGDYELDMNLHMLNSDYAVCNYRSSAFWYFFVIWVLTLGVAVLYAIIGWTKLEFTGLPIMLSLIIIMGALCVATFPKKRSAVFSNRGGQPVFEICKCGKDKERFEEVVSLLTKLISDVPDK